MFLQQHISSIDNQFAAVQTSLANSKVTGAQRQSMLGSNNRISTMLMIPNQSKMLVRNYLTKAENGTINIHQLTSFQMATHGSNSPFLTVFVSNNMDESLKLNPYTDANTYFDGNMGTIQRIINSQAYNTLLSFDLSASQELIPFAATNWNNVEDNKAVFLIFEAITKAAANENEEMIEQLWTKYLAVVQQQVKAQKLIHSAILLASQNSLFAGNQVFTNTKSSNPNYNGASIYGSKEHKSSFMPYTTMFNGSIKKTSVEFIEDSLKDLIKPNFTYGFHESKRNNKTQVDTEVFDPASYLDDVDSSTTVTKSDPKKSQSFSSLLYTQDHNGRLSLLQGIVSDRKQGGKIIKRSDSFSSIEMESELVVLSAKVVPRSLNSGMSEGRVGIIDGMLYGSLSVTFELFDMDYRGLGRSDGITSNSIASDLGTMEDLDSYLGSLGNEVDIVSTVDSNSVSISGSDMGVSDTF